MSNCATTCPLSGLRKILLATDGSQFSEGAEREALNFAKNCSSKVYAMSVAEILTDYEAFSPQRIEEMRDAEIKKHLESVKSRASEEKTDCEVLIAHGDPYTEIVEAASANRVDMIVIGRRGKTGLKKLLMGEVAAKVIGHAPSRVLVVPKAARIEFKKLLVATDGSQHSEQAVAEAVGIAKCCGSELLILSAMRDESEQEEAQAHVNRAADIARNEGVNAETITPIGRSYDVIVETAGGRGVDLIVMGTYGKTGIRKVLMGSSTEKVIGYAGCAVLVVRT
ncbi:MAG: universal stress protein [Nitrospiraceae bacterium]|nr:MAG: universal stress protein [Nitrospiraceae bacterium]